MTLGEFNTCRCSERPRNFFLCGGRAGQTRAVVLIVSIRNWCEMETSMELHSQERCGPSMARQLYSNCRFIEAAAFPNTNLLTFYVTCGKLVTPVQ